MESDVLLEEHYPRPLLAIASYGLDVESRFPNTAAPERALACDSSLGHQQPPPRPTIGRSRGWRTADNS